MDHLFCDICRAIAIGSSLASTNPIGCALHVALKFSAWYLFPCPHHCKHTFHEILSHLLCGTVLCAQGWKLLLQLLILSFPADTRRPLLSREGTWQYTICLTYCCTFVPISPSEVLKLFEQRLFDVSLQPRSTAPRV